MQPKLLVGREIPVEKAALAQHVAAFAAERVRRGRDKTGGIEVLAETPGVSGVGIAGQVGAAHDVECPGICRVAGIDDAARPSAGARDDAADGPAGESRTK